jgi:hypothetical protein
MISRAIATKIRNITHSVRRRKATMTRSSPGLPLIRRARSSSAGSIFSDSR